MRGLGWYRMEMELEMERDEKDTRWVEKCEDGVES
jgi:hypothetical protein